MFMSREPKPSIFGVKIDNMTQTELFSHITTFLTSKKYHCIVTLNPEILLMSRKDMAYKNILNTSALDVADGIGVGFALLWQGIRLKKRFTGVDLIHDILKEVDKRAGDVFLATHREGLSSWKEVRDKLVILYPHISFFGKDIDPEHCDDVVDEISADVVLCNFGAPDQEMFLSKLSDEHAKIGVGIGGAFDYITGAIPRAPQYMRTIGMEWLYRLYRQPHRWRRICNAVVIFPLLVIIYNK